MKNSVKTPEQIEGIRKAARLASDTLVMLNDHVKPGITTGELDAIAHKFITDAGGWPTSLYYKGFPKSVCTSVNHVVCHGIPGDKKLKKGDIINIDVAVTLGGFIGDTSKMYEVGKVGVQGHRLCHITYECMQQGIAAIEPGKDISVIGNAIEKHLRLTGLPFSIVRNYCGHGTGVEFHEDLQVLHFAYPDRGIVLEPGMVFTIEPMINAGKPMTKIMPDEWTVVTKDHTLSAQWEHTILVTEDGFEILTLREEELELWSGSP